jgi:hypothetical protein
MGSKFTRPLTSPAAQEIDPFAHGEDAEAAATTGPLVHRGHVEADAVVPYDHAEFGVFLL